MNVLIPCSVGLTTYGFVKVSEYLCTRPTTSQVACPAFRNLCANFQVYVEKKLGPERWHFVRNVVLDNAWISACALSILLQHYNRPMGYEEVAYVGLEFICIASLSWITRLGISKCVPPIVPYIGPRT